MAWVFRTYGCGACEEAGRPPTFELMQDRSEPPPRFCPRCGEDFGGELDPIPSKIAIGGSPIAKAVDGTYRWAEDSSAARAEEHNAPYMKVTNMKDNLREGDVAAMPLPRNVVTQYLEESNQKFGARYGFQGPAAASGEERPAIDNAFVGPGHVALSAAQGAAGQTHATRRAAIEAQGKLLKPKG